MTVQPLWSRASIIAPARSNNLRVSAFKVNFHWQYCRKSIIRIENRNILYMFFVLIYIYICLLIHTLNNPYVNDQWYLKVEWRFSGYLRCFIHPYWRDFPTIRSLCESWEEGWNLAIEKAAKKNMRPVNDVQHDEGQSSAYHPWHSHRPGFDIAGLDWEKQWSNQTKQSLDQSGLICAE